MYYTKYNLRAQIRSTQRKRENLGVFILMMFLLLLLLLLVVVVVAMMMLL